MLTTKCGLRSVGDLACHHKLKDLIIEKRRTEAKYLQFVI